MPWSRVMGLRSVYSKTVRDSRRATIAVGIIGGLTLLGTAAAYGPQFTTEASRQALIGQMTLLPAVFRGLLGEPIHIDILGGFLSWRVGNILPVMLGIWSVLALSGTLAGEASAGSLDILASTPVPRRSIAIQKLAGHVTAVAVVVVVLTLAVWLSGKAFATLPGDDIALADAAGFAMLVGLLMLACGSVSFAVAPIVGRTRALAFGLVFLFGGYLISTYGSLSSFIAGLGPISWFHWTADHRPLAGVTDWPAVGLLAVVTIALMAAGLLTFEKRDLGSAAALSWLRLPSLPAGIGGPMTRQLADRTGVALAWGIGIGVYAGIIASTSKQFGETILKVPQIAALIRRLYPSIDLTQPSGLLQLAFFGFGFLLLGLAAAGFVAGWASDETEGRLDVVLSAPITRARWFVRSGLGVMAAVAVMTVSLAIILAISVVASGGDPRDPVLGTLVLGVAAAGYAGIGLAVGGLVRSSLAAPIAGIAVIATFLIDTLGAALNLPDPILELSVSKHLGQPMAGSYDPVGIVAAAVLAIGGLLLGAWGLQRRDVGK